MEEQVQILLIEDNGYDAELTVRILKKVFSMENLHHLDNGELALEYLFGKGRYEGRDISIKPKVILLDLKMPKVSGLEVLEKIKQDVNTRHIPVVIFTSSRENSDVEKCYAMGANSYVVKPVEYEHFSKAVHEVGNFWLNLNYTTIST